MSEPDLSESPTGVPTCYRHAGRETWIRCQRCERSICPDCMRDAAVGFQCPDCVAQGARTTRSGRTAYGGLRSANPALTSLVLIGINLAVWLAVLVTGGNSSRLVDVLALRPNGGCTPGDGYIYEITAAACQAGHGVFLPGVADGAWWQLVTGMFLHVAVWHIAGNMLALYFVGPQLEAVLGRARFLALYLLSGLAGSAAVLWWAGEYTPTLGASGAIYGLFGALAVVVLKVGGDLRALLTLFVINGFITFAIPGISWQGHVGGLAGGLVVAGILLYAPRVGRARVQALGLAGVAVALALAVALRLVTLG